MTLNNTTAESILKEIYTPELIQGMIYPSNPFFAMVNKNKSFGGKYKVIPLKYGNPQSRSASSSEAAAQVSAASTKLVDFNLTRVTDYAFGAVQHETLKASRGNSSAFVEALKLETDGIIHALERSIATSLFRSRDGWIGQVNAEPSEAATTVVTLKEPEDVVNFEVGQKVNIWSAVSGGSQRNFDGSVTGALISAVDRSAGTITINATYNASGTIAANDYIFLAGDRGVRMAGLLDWIPPSAPSSTAFYGVDRSVDSVRLGGLRHDGSAQTIEEALIDLASKIAREGGKPDTCFLSFKKYAELEKSLSSKVVYCDVEPMEGIGFRGLVVNGSRGPIKVLPDQNCPNAYAWMLTLDTWTLHSIGEPVSLFDEDGKVVLRDAPNDAVNFYAYFYGNLACNAPGWNGILSF